ncbi:hypothetical protein BT96DRAFT_1035887 [Gymnopus androsaceus JB14]|uniref:Uncharacterized protein n=1 Tax=Gymnopus androsaceus JB14 TaxID=1447944 RepID=A0A6A4HK08_9AGAR|nr:hypothetical protein BT96DRAFT_1035887 [Gymnopus androsaceus JB14]
MSSVAKSFTLLPKIVTASTPRIVIITHGAKSMTVASAPFREFTRFDRWKKRLRTRTRRDAFAGGFLGAYVSGRDLDACIETGHRLTVIRSKEVRNTSGQRRGTRIPPLQNANGKNVHKIPLALLNTRGLIAIRVQRNLFLQSTWTTLEASIGYVKHVKQ